MSDPAPAQGWWSAAELAEAGLPDLPRTKRKVNEMARREGWGGVPGKVRRRRASRGRWQSGRSRESWDALRPRCGTGCG